MTDYGSIGLDKNLRPLNSPVSNYLESETSAFQFDSTHERGAIDNVQMKDYSVTAEKLNTDLSGTINNTAFGTPDITGGTAYLLVLENPTVSTQSATGGTIRNVLLGTSTITGGTISGVLLGTSTVTGGTLNVSQGTLSSMLLGTCQITGGSVSNAVIGTPNLSGGTVDPSLFKIGGSAGVDATVVYVGSVNFAGSSTTKGTMIFNKGLLISSA